MNIFLASKSPRRQSILKLMQIPFKIFDSNINEDNVFNLTPFEYVKNISYEKAIFASKNISEDCIVIAADTVVVFQGTILGKPQNDDEAFKMLSTLSGKKHSVYTGLTVISKKRDDIEVKSEVEITYVYMKNISDKEIFKYIKTGEPFDKAGAYGIQEKGGLFIEKVEGDYFNVVGLPISKLNLILKEINIDITDFWI